MLFEIKLWEKVSEDSQIVNNNKQKIAYNWLTNTISDKQNPLCDFLLGYIRIGLTTDYAYF